MAEIFRLRYCQCNFLQPLLFAHTIISSKKNYQYPVFYKRLYHTNHLNKLLCHFINTTQKEVGKTDLFIVCLYYPPLKKISIGGHRIQSNGYFLRLLWKDGKFFIQRKAVLSIIVRNF